MPLRSFESFYLTLNRHRKDRCAGP